MTERRPRSEMTAADISRLTGIDAPKISRGVLELYGLSPVRTQVEPSGYRRRLWSRADVSRLLEKLKGGLK